mgnify:FL=1
MAVGGAGELVLGTGSAAERANLTAEMVADGVLLPVAVEGLREVRHVLADERLLLDATVRPGRADPSVTILAPLDPFIWDRRLLKSLFGFDYIWAICVPAPMRRFGY